MHQVFVQTLSIFADVERMGDFLYKPGFASFLKYPLGPYVEYFLCFITLL